MRNNLIPHRVSINNDRKLNVRRYERRSLWLRNPRYMRGTEDGEEERSLLEEDRDEEKLHSGLPPARFQHEWIGDAFATAMNRHPAIRVTFATAVVADVAVAVAVAAAAAVAAVRPAAVISAAVS
jgi:hypothetical protein